MGQISKAFVIAGILMQGNANDASMYSKDAILGLLPLFVLNVLVPKWVSEEVQPNQGGSAFKKPAYACQKSIHRE